jgi:hypothetical protein
VAGVMLAGYLAALSLLLSGLPAALPICIRQTI